MQKTAFWKPKGRLLYCNMPSFASQKAMFCNAAEALNYFNE